MTWGHQRLQSPVLILQTLEMLRLADIHPFDFQV